MKNIDTYRVPTDYCNTPFITLEAQKESALNHDLKKAMEEGLVAIGGDLTSQRLIHAYQSGYFPWYDDNQPILWWSPNPRMVLFPKKLHISKSLNKVWKQKRFHLSCNSAFQDVIRACAHRQHNTLPSHETWIHPEMKEAYLDLHQKGYAHSVEVWQDERLVGGLYGIALHNIFFGESMFSRVSNMSKIALTSLSKYLLCKEYKMMDCQIENPHLVSMGAENIPKEAFLKQLADNKKTSSNHPLIDSTFAEQFNDFFSSK